MTYATSSVVNVAFNRSQSNTEIANTVRTLTPFGGSTWSAQALTDAWVNIVEPTLSEPGTYHG